MGCNSRLRDFLFGFFERWDHLPSLWSILCGGQLRSAVRNDQLAVRICMENESPARGKTEEVLQEIELYPGKCLRDTTQRVGSPRLDHVAVLSIETKPYSAVLCSGLEISSPRASISWAAGNCTTISRPVGWTFSARIVPRCMRIASEAIASPRPFPPVASPSPLIR